MEVERRTASTLESSCDVVESHSRAGQRVAHLHATTNRNIEIDWREVDPYFSELSDCASFWTLINFTCDVIYSGLFVLFFIMGQDVESMFFEGLLNHINPILIYLILSLIINYGALRSLRCGREKCFLVFSVMKTLLFPITMSLLIYLVFFDVQEYFGTFWLSFVVIVSCYNGTAALGLWSMFTCNKYILVNEAAQKRLRKQQRSNSNEADCRCGISATQYYSRDGIRSSSRPAASSSSFCTPIRNTNFNGASSSSCANNIILVCKPDSILNVDGGSKICKKGNKIFNEYQPKIGSGCGPSRKMGSNAFSTAVMSFANEDEEDADDVLQISTVHKVMQEIRLLDSPNDCESSEDCESL